MFVPVGGGALAAGVASALRALRPGTRIVGVEAANYPSLYASRRAGRPVWVAAEHTICDGVAVPFASDALFPLLARVLDDVVLVSEDEARAAMRRLAVESKLVAEGAGAIALAAALRLRPEPQSQSSRAAMPSRPNSPPSSPETAGLLTKRG